MPPRKRVHVVLIPGFAGFDALGQLEYYAGVTPLFRAANFDSVVLRYFDNFPTAAVATRASRLKKYLVKRVARGEIGPHDEVALVGHSTGGLDIRWMLQDLAAMGDQAIIVDGGAAVSAEQVLPLIRRVVFLSVPHWGTNIADRVRSFPVLRDAVVTELGIAVAGAQLPLLDRIEEWITGRAADLTGTGLLRAVQDSLIDADARIGDPGPERSAEAHEAAALLALYLRQMASDFRAIDDLTALPPPGEPQSPAHFPPGVRRRELKVWREREIDTISFVTVSPPPGPDSDIVYHTCYGACASGPFERPSARVSLNPRPPKALTPADNDGIVNTLSMIWPQGDNLLIDADHMDIVGHYQPGSRSYDLLGSASGFDSAAFRQVWSEVFRFCAAAGD